MLTGSVKQGRTEARARDSHADRRLREDRRYPSEDIVAADSLILPDSAVDTEDRRDERKERRAPTKKKSYVDIY
jgi:hypothetical protein